MDMAAETKYYVLAVDDTFIDRKLIEKLLKTYSYQVTAVEFIGVNKKERNPKADASVHVEVNLIITDYCMPGIIIFLSDKLLVDFKNTTSIERYLKVIMSSDNIPSRINRCREY
ncbi:hypothetical protein GQ457_11G008040 [Hibiscus cannabinus]